jgi:propionate CoA-transferase
MKQITPDEIASLIPDNVGIATSGFIGCAFPEMLAICIEESFLEKGKPNNLSIFFAAGQGDSKDKGLNHLGHEGLLRFALGSHFGLLPRIVELIINNKIEAYAFPQGIMTHLFRAASAKAPCVISKVGLGTFVDPRVNSGSLNDISKSKFVELFKIGNEEYLQYSSKPFEKIKIALLRGTTSDELGNITMEKEGLTGEVLQFATMVHNNGGRVLV